jgi:hypothetical protein
MGIDFELGIDYAVMIENSSASTAIEMCSNIPSSLIYD